MEKYKNATLQMLTKIHSEELWKKVFTFVKVLLEKQGD